MKFIVLIISLIIFSCTHQKPQSSTATTSIPQPSVPAPSPIIEDTPGISGSENEIQHDDPLNMDFQVEIKRHRELSSANDLCQQQPAGFELYRPQDCTSEVSFSVTYGDFDGDLKSDSYAILMNVKTKKGFGFIWFGGNQKPEALSSYQILEVQNKKFDEDKLISFFKKNSSKNKGLFQFGKSSKFDMEIVFFAGQPKTFQAFNYYSLRRSILFQNIDKTVDVRFFIIDKSTKKILFDYVNQM